MPPLDCSKASFSITFLAKGYSREPGETTDSQASAGRAPIQDEELGEVDIEKAVEAPSSAVVGEPDISIVTRVRGPEPGERWAGGAFVVKGNPSPRAPNTHT